MTQVSSPLARSPVEIEERRHVGSRPRLDLFVAQRGRCAICGEKRMLSEFDLDHRIALELGGADEPDNWQLICRDTCHKAKTAKDRKAIAKAKRLARDADPETRRHSPNPLRGRGFRPADDLKVRT